MKKTVESFGVDFLVHFTRATNIPSIMNHGIVPVQDLNYQNIVYDWNDSRRIDGCLNASCFSVGFPNYKMFFTYRKNNPSVDWVVLGIDKNVLWEKTCAFCTENAAKNSMTSLTILERSGNKSFSKLFDDFPGKPNRRILNLEGNIPTNPQAEVLVFDTVEPSRILGAIFENEQVKEKYKNSFPKDFPIGVNTFFYSGRHDHQYW